MPTPTPNLEIAALLGGGAIAVTFEGEGDTAALLKAERACTTEFSSARRSEYAAGRACVRAALRHFDIHDFPLVTQADRQPRWPPGIVGSITHSGPVCGAVVARDLTFASIGIDVEHRGRVERDLWPMLFIESERHALAQASEGEADLAATLVFSAKEAFYKCRYRLTTRWLDFSDVYIELGPADDSGVGTFVARLVTPDRHECLNEMHGRFRVASNLVWTAVAVEA